jgi:hypothetical protein
VFFDTLSNATAYAVTIGLTAVAANAADISIAGPLVGNVTITSAATSVINCYGSWLNAATGVAFTSTAGSIVNFLATTTGKTITNNGVSLGNLNLRFDSATGGWELGSALTLTTTISVLQGSFSTSTSSWGLTCGSIATTGTVVRSISLNSSLVSITGTSQINFGATTNLTFNAGTSSIVCSTTTSSFTGGGQTFYNVSYTALGQISASITGANTFNNLTFPVKTAVSVANITIAANQIVTGTLTMAGSTYAARFQLVSATIGTPFTFTAGAVSLAYVDFRDIVGAGTATWTGTSIGDCLGNTNITFDAPKTVYRNLAGAQLWAANGWAASSGGAPAVASYPLPQDTAVFDDVGAAGTISSWAANTGSVDMSARTLSSPFTAVNTLSVYGNWINGTGTVLSGAGTINFLGRSLQTITPAGITFGSGITVTAFGGTVRIEAALTATSTLVLTNGTLDLNDFTFTTTTLVSTNSNTRSIAFGTGDITVTANGTTVVSMSIVAGFSYTGTPTINATYSGSTGTRTYTFGTSGVQTESQAISLNVTAGGDAFTFTNGTRINSIDFTGAYTGLATFGTGTYQCYGDFTLNSLMTITAGAIGISFSSTSVTPRTITSAGQTLNFGILFNGIGGTWQLQDTMTVGTASLTTLTSGTIDLNNQTLSTGLFTSTGALTRTIAFGTGNMTCTGVGQVFAATITLGITGTPLVNVTSAGSTLITVIPGPLLEANAISFNFTGGTYPLNFLGSSGNAARSVNFTGFAGTWLDIAGTTIYGDLTLSSGMVIDPSTSTLTFASTSPTPRTIESSGNTMDFPIAFNGVGGTWQLVDPMTLNATRTMTLTNGTLDASLAGFTTGVFSSSNSNIRSLIVGSYSYTILGTGTSWNVTDTTNFTLVGGSSASILMDSAGSNTFSGGLISDGSAWPTVQQNNTGTLTIAGGGTFYAIQAFIAPSTILFTGGASYSALFYQLEGSAGNLITIGSTSTTPTTLSKPTAWLMGVNSVDAGNNTGLTFGVGDGNIDYVSASYIDGHINTTFDADCAETATSTDILTPNGIYKVVLAAASATATDSTTRSTLWNIIDDTQIPGWTPIST